MAEQKSFKERVKETVIHNAYSYKNIILTMNICFVLRRLQKMNIIL